MTRVLLLGDTHRNNGFLKQIIDIAIAQEVDTIVQLGDFAYDFKHRKFFKNIARFTETGGLFYFVAGNHDDWDFLDAITPDYPKPVAMDQYDQPKANHDEPTTPFPKGLYYLPRGAVVTIGGRVCMGMGGAFSIDKDWRTPHVDYWPGEMLTEADIYRTEEIVRNQGPVPIDVLLTHDIPVNTYPFEQLLRPLGYKIDEESKRNRTTLARITDIVEPVDLYHGHYHHRHEGLYETPNGWRVNVHGIGADVPDGRPSMDYNYVIEYW